MTAYPRTLLAAHVGPGGEFHLVGKLVVVAVFVEGDEFVSDVAGYMGSRLAADAF